jgi:hypothetical protein
VGTKRARGEGEGEVQVGLVQRIDYFVKKIHQNHHIEGGKKKKKKSSYL